MPWLLLREGEELARREDADGAVGRFGKMFGVARHDGIGAAGKCRGQVYFIVGVRQVVGAGAGINNLGRIDESGKKLDEIGPHMPEPRPCQDRLVFLQCFD